MNKYRKAYNDIVDNGITTEYFNEQAKRSQEENTIFIINELVDKEIPQPIATNGKIYFCDKCDGTVWQIKSESNYCFRCGQKIDWSVLDE